MRSNSNTHMRRERKEWSGRQKMVSALGSKPLLLGLVLVMFLGTAVYFRLWVIDYQISSSDSELLRRQFDVAHREAVDESAEWRLRFDEERERATTCMKELTELKESLLKKEKSIPAVDGNLEKLEKEKAELLGQFESLKKELETERLRCKSL